MGIAFKIQNERTYAVLFGGIGGASVGYNRSSIDYGGKVHRLRQLCSIDYDPIASLNHDNITGENKAVVMDLFTRKQYAAWHGNEPPMEWQEVTPWDLWVAFDYQIPYFLFTSPPCKGLSALLPAASANSAAYQALNELTVRGIDLALRACLEYGGGLPAFIQLENVPRIQTRGKKHLKQIQDMLKKFGFAVNMRSDHNLGEIGGLGQNRLRFLILSRDESQVPNFVYMPPKKKMKTIGDVIGPLPMPGDIENGGPLHRLPRLQWKTWVRLALIPAGGDWRDLQNVPYEQYRIVHEPRAGAFAIEDWDDASRPVTGTAGPGRSNGAAALSDPRLEINGDGKANLYRVQKSDESGQCVTGAVGVSNGAPCISDPNLKDREGRHPGVYRVVRYDEESPCVTGTRFGSGAIAVADPKLGDIPKFNHAYKVSKCDETSGAVASGGGPSNGGIVIADPKVNTKLMPDSYGVQDWDNSAKAVRAANRTMQSAASINDPRVNGREGRYTDQYRMQSTDNPSATATGVTDVQAGAQLIADPNIKCSPRSGTMGIIGWGEVSPAVIGSSDVHAAASAVADPRPIPTDKEQGVWILIAEDGTWHRPLTTYELAMMQSFPQYMPDGKPFQLVGCTDAKAREYIGNAVPPDAAEAMGNVILLAAAQAEEGVTFEFSHEEVWVIPEEDRIPVMVH